MNDNYADLWLACINLGLEWKRKDWRLIRGMETKFPVGSDKGVNFLGIKEIPSRKTG
jgi:hypothetical protein